MFPDIIIEYDYEELGCCFCGCEIYLAGRTLYTVDAEISVYCQDHYDDEPEKLPPYEEGFHERRIQVEEETAEFKRGKITICTNRNGYIFKINGEFIDLGIERLGLEPYDYR